MKNTKVIDKIKIKLRFTNEQFLDVKKIKKILAISKSWYTISELVRKGLIEPIKRNTVYINKVIWKKPNAEALIWLYFKWSDYMFWWLGIYNKYGFTTQVAQKQIVYNTKVYWEKKIWNHNFIFKKKRPSFFRWRELKKQQDVKYYIMKRERALIQLLVDKKWIVEFEQKIFEQLNSWAIDVISLKQLWDMHLSKKNKVILEKFITRWLKN